MRAAGLDVEVKTGLTPEELCAALPGVAALVIRSATQVTAEVLAAGTDLVVVGRAGIGLDNVDVAEATRRGVMVVNAPQSNILSAAEHTMALLLAQARNVPQANADLTRRPVEPLEVGRRRAARQDARHRRPRPRRRARRAAGARVRDAARRVRPVREPRSGPPARRAARRHDGRAGRDLRLRDDPRDEDARHDRPRERRRARARQARDAARQRRAAAASSTRTRSPTRSATAASAAPRSTRSRRSRPPSRRCSSSTTSSSRRTSARRPPRRRTRRGRRSPSRSCSRCAATSCRSRSTSRRRRRRRSCGRSCRSPSGSAGCSPGWPAARRRRSTSFYEGEIADYDCRVLTLSILKGVLGPVVAEPVIVRERAAARRGARHRGARDEVGRRAQLREPHRGARPIGERAAQAAGTLFGKQQGPRIVGIDEHTVDLPPARHMLVVHNDDTPGMIGRVTTRARRRGASTSPTWASVGARAAKPR